MKTSRFDHLLLANRHPIEVARFAAAVARTARGDLLQIHVEHEADGSCCAAEPWPRTLVELLEQTAASPPAGGRT